jgi:arsenate reductase
MLAKRVTIFHNPACGTSRKVLALLHERGIEPEVVEYLKTPPSRNQIHDMIARSGLPARDFLRTRESLYKELDLDNPKWSEDQLVEFLVANPSLLNRPVVETARGVRPCRPAETVLPLLD